MVEDVEIKEHVVSVAVARPLDTLFTYRIKESQLVNAQFGNWVKVPFGRGLTTGYIASLPRVFDPKLEALALEKLKWIEEIGSPKRIPPAEILDLAQWSHRYYLTPLGEALSVAYPKSLHEPAARPKKEKGDKDLERAISSQALAHSVTLNTEQQQAVVQFTQKIDNKPARALLEGVTGSGKTEVYGAIAREYLKRDRGVLYLLPEIALTAQSRERLEKLLGRSVVLWHSAISEGERKRDYELLLSGKRQVVLGARSALFAPIHNLGLIIVDEEHDSSYKQEERFRYHARDLAFVRAEKVGASLLLGSATPSLETLEKVRTGKIQHLRLSRKFHQEMMDASDEIQSTTTLNTPLKIELIDLTEAPMTEGVQSPLSEEVVNALRDVKAKNEQALIFLNRKGFAPVLMCFDCKFIYECENCSSKLTYYERGHRLVCHFCGAKRKPEDTCPKCLSQEVHPVGAGTEALEEDLLRILAEAKTLRLDRSVITSAKRLENTIRSFREEKADFLIGTQMIAKGHDFSKVSLVVVLMADDLFHAPDFRAPERALQTLLQVAGRGGRAGQKSRVLIQTYQPEHPVFGAMIDDTLRQEFLESERQLRMDLKFPPFFRVTRLRLESPTQDLRSAENLAHALKSEASRSHPEVEILGPAIPLMERIEGKYRVDIHLRGAQVGGLQHLARSAIDWSHSKGLTLVVDVDPLSLG